MDDPPTQQSPRWRPRFSLLSSLLLMAIVALSIVVIQFYRELVPLRAELRQLRNEVGRLSIEDPSKPCAIQVRATGENTWKWRVWIPKGRAYVLKYTSERIPKNGIPASHGSMSLENAGETWVEYSIAKKPDTELYYDKLATPQGSVGSSPQEWVKWLKRISTDDGVGNETKEFETGKNIVLARQRVSQNVSSSNLIEDPAAGFMIWLEPTK